ncbi:STAS domain-containing protein [candidate division KSB1 bacterium]|nr:STAS domain-containing protein [candidate division KSB1 bacterium]
MLTIEFTDAGIVHLEGRFDASQEQKALEAFARIDTSVQVDCRGLEYISSVGIGALLFTQKRLNDMGHRLKLLHLNPHIMEIFRLAGFDAIFEIE